MKLFKLDEVPMFFMRESPGSHPAKPQPTDPLEERVKMTPDIRLEFRMKVKAGPQTIGVAFLQKGYAANEDLVRRPVSSTYDVFIGMQYGYTTAPHLSRVVITGPYNPTGLGDTPSRRRVFVCRPDVGRQTKAPCARQIVSTLVRRAYRRAPTDADVESLLAFYQQERDAHRQLRGRDRDGAAPDPGRSGVHLPLRAGAGRRSRGVALSHQRHRARVAAVVLPLVDDSRTMSC